MGIQAKGEQARNFKGTMGRLLKYLSVYGVQLVVVLLSGRPLLITDELPLWDTFVAAWLPGTEGQGVADVLTGERPFTGRLSYDWPRTQAGLVRGTMDTDGATVVCHSTLFNEPQENAICRGWYDRLAGRDNMLRLAEAMGIIEEVPVSET